MAGEPNVFVRRAVIKYTELSPFEVFSQKRPCVIVKEKCPVLASCDEISDILRAAGNAWRQNSTINFGLWLNGAQPARNIGKLLMSANDADITQYLDRVTQRGEHEFCMALYHAQIYNSDVWLRGLSFISALFSGKHLPNGEVDMDVFMGRYHETPRGVHTDSADTFMYIVEGGKTLAFWPAAYFDDMSSDISGDVLHKTLQADLSEAFLKDAIILNAQPGDIVYWPASYWHVGLHEDSSKPTVALNIGIFRRQAKDNMAQTVLTGVEQILKEQHEGFAVPDISDGSDLPEISRDLLRDDQAFVNMMTLMGQEDWFQKLAYTEWLRRCSALGFQNVPKPGPQKLYTGEAVKLRMRDIPILFKSFGAELLVAAYGHVNIFENNVDITECLETLNKGHTVNPKSLPKTIQALLYPVIETLIAVRALTVLESEMQN